MHRVVPNTILKLCLKNCFDQLEVNQVVQVQMSPIYLLLLEEKTFKIVQAVCATE